MKIIRIVRKDEKNVIVFFDNEEKIILSEDVFFQSGLRKGDEVSEDRFSFFVEQNIIYHIKQRAFSFLSRRFHSERELFFKLKSKSYDERLIKIVLSDLKSKNYLNDNIFAANYLEEKLNKKKWGINKIKSALYNKGISSKIVDEVLSKVDNQEDINLAMELAEKKFNQLKNTNADKKKYYQKLSVFLVARGFDFDTCREVCSRILKQDFN